MDKQLGGGGTKPTKNSPRPGGRAERNRQSVVQAVLSLIEAGKADFELQEVAKMSGVHRTTVYRRWPRREELLKEALVFNATSLEVPVGDDWEDYLQKLGSTLSEFLSRPIMVAIGSLMASPVTPRAFAEHATIQFGFVIDRLVQPLVQAQNRGEFRREADPYVIINLLLSYIISFTVITKTKPTEIIIKNTINNLCLIGQTERH